MAKPTKVVKQGEKTPPPEIHSVPMRLTVEIITPAVAREYLSHNTANRDPRMPVVRRYAQAMEDGKWKLTAEPIQFDMDGVLINGQQRLMAVIESDTAVAFCVVRDCPIDSPVVLDNGVIRTASDAAKYLGIDGFTSRHASIIRAAVSYGAPKRKWTGKVSNEQIFRFYSVYKGDVDFAESVYRRGGIANAACMSVMARAHHHGIQPSQIEDFVDIVNTNLPKGTLNPSAPLALARNFLTQSQYGSGGAGQQLTRIADSEHALWAYLKDMSVKFIRGTKGTVHWPIEFR